MKTRFLVIMLILSLTLVLAVHASGGKESVQDGPVTLNWYAHAATLSNTQAEIVAEFNKQYPDITINVIELPEDTSGKLQALLIALRSGDSSVDFFNADVTWTATFASAGLIEPMEKYFPPEERAKFLPGTIDAATYNGQVWGVPFRTDAGVLYYRADLLEKYGKPVPSTYEELFKTSEEIIAGEKNGMYALVGSLSNGEGLTCNAVEWYYSNGGSVIDENNNIVIDSPQNRQILQTMVDAYAKGLMPEGVLSYGSGDARASMFQEKQVFMRAWPKAYAMGQDPANSNVVGKLGVAPLPRGPQGTEGVSVLGGWQLFMNKNSRHKEAAALFMNFYASEYAQKLHALNDTYLPARTSLYQDEDILAAYPFYAMFPDVFKTAAPRPKSPFYAEISGILSTEVQNAMKGSKSVAQALSDAQANMEKVGR